ncbi:hypothetical protein PILCRDRAFT_314555 [Piloderma croceum F 1598]|uniref:Uncharacterized protein n=1 Tax=Piloderma croceum (strain F 1598) TaxID=765440 RepID=A0A0C3FS02_PILCF|nr:hypothetical protein PILCRDRAFT_314555 [Piloderma croceum F 1598]
MSSSFKVACASTPSMTGRSSGRTRELNSCCSTPTTPLKAEPKQEVPWPGLPPAFPLCPEPLSFYPYSLIHHNLLTLLLDVDKSLLLKSKMLIITFFLNAPTSNDIKSLWKTCSKTRLRDYVLYTLNRVYSICTANKVFIFVSNT